MTSRGTTNTNARGSANDRRRRKQYLLDAYGDGVQAPCAFGCGTMVDFHTVTVDRYPVPGCEGGTYRRGNIRPACGRCNSIDGALLGARRRNVANFSESKSAVQHNLV